MEDMGYYDCAVVWFGFKHSILIVYQVLMLTSPKRNVTRRLNDVGPLAAARADRDCYSREAFQFKPHLDTKDLEVVWHYMRLVYAFEARSLDDD